MDYYEMVTEKIREQEALDKRMQADTDLLYLEKYQLKDTADKEVPDVINITLNRPAVFGANIVAAIGQAKQQVIVSTEDKKVDTYEVEQFLRNVFLAADRKLWEKGLPTLDRFADVQLCFRGRTARRVLLRQENGQTKVDIRYWDGRYTYYDFGAEDLTWAGYITRRKKGWVETEYGEAIATKLTGSDASVLDVWDKTHEEVWINNEKVKEQAHSYGFTPIVFQVVPLGYGAMLPDPGWQKHEGESIFFMIRDIVPEVNRLATILQTLNMNQIKTALQFGNPDGTPQDEPPERPNMGDVISVGKGTIAPINLGEARLSFQLLYNIMEKAFQEGSYTDIDIGNVQQPFSAVALITIGESKDMVYMPRLAAKELLNVATAEMIVKQALQIGGTIELGRPGHKQRFSTSSLQGEYSIDYKYYMKSPKIDIARLSMADVAAKWYPRSYILSEILQAEDPDGLLREWHKQEAENLSIGVKMHRIIMDLLTIAEKNNDEEAAREAQILALEMGLTLDQIKAGQMQPPTPEKQLPPKPLLPLIARGGNLLPNTNQMASDLQKTPEESANAIAAS